MGIALINEVIFPKINEGLIKPLERQEDPMKGLYQTIKDFMLSISEIQLANGCPTNNVIQEMAPVNENFRNTLQSVLQLWEDAIVSVLEKAVQRNQISSENDLRGVAGFIIASYEGARGTGKLYRSYGYYEKYLRQLKIYLSSL